jgi:hypothetical protein
MIKVHAASVNPLDMFSMNGRPWLSDALEQFSVREDLAQSDTNGDRYLPWKSAVPPRNLQESP